MNALGSCLDGKPLSVKTRDHNIRELNTKPMQSGFVGTTNQLIAFFVNLSFDPEVEINPRAHERVPS